MIVIIANFVEVAFIIVVVKYIGIVFVVARVKYGSCFQISKYLPRPFSPNAAHWSWLVRYLKPDVPEESFVGQKLSDQHAWQGAWGLDALSNSTDRTFAVRERGASLQARSLD